MLNNLHFRIVSCSLVLLATLSAQADNLINDPALNLNTEITVPDVRQPSEDLFEFSYGARNWGRPSLRSTAQSTQYDFSDRTVATLSYERLWWQKQRLSTQLRLSYFDIQQQNTTGSLTRMHVIPLHAELQWRMFNQRLSPVVGAGVLGIIQIQRGVELNQTSELSEAWVGRAGLDWRINQQWGLRTTYFYQKSWASESQQWNGSAYDAGVTFSL